MRRGRLLLLAAAAAPLLLSAAATEARAEYRAYELEVVDLYDCRINERERCRTSRLRTALDPRTYVQTHGGPFHIGVLLLATWMCYGDTSFYDPVCPRPEPREPRFGEGDTVRITLGKHITEAWVGRVEVAYYQPSLRANVYGVRFPDRRGVYARYYGKDLAPAGEEAEQGQGGTEAAGAETGRQPGAARAQPAAAAP